MASEKVVSISDRQRKLFMINAEDTSLPRQSELAWSAIVAANESSPIYFKVGGKPFQLVRDDDDDRGVWTSQMRVDDMSRLSSETAFWFKNRENKSTKEKFPAEVYPQERVMRNLIVTPSPPLPSLKRIVAAPVLADDGTISFQEGYQPGNKTYFHRAPNLVLKPFNTPTEGEALESVGWIIENVFTDFSWVDKETDLPHALSLMLNPIIRDLIDGPTPLYLIEAAMPNSGKSLLAKVCMLPALGRSVEFSPLSGKAEETRKLITALLMELPEVIAFDNVDTTLKDPGLAAALTAVYWKDRILSKSETTPVLPVKNTWIATANNPTMTREMMRRFCRIRIVTSVPGESRTKFKHSPVPLEMWVARHRSEILTHLYRIVLYWVSEGMLDGSKTKSTYERWAQVHSGILEAVGFEGFLDKRADEDLAVAPTELAFETFIEAWWSAHGTKVVTTSDLLPIANQIEGMPLGTKDTAHSQSSVLGRAIKRQNKAIFCGKYQVHVLTEKDRLNKMQFQLSTIVKQQSLEIRTEGDAHV